MAFGSVFLKVQISGPLKETREKGEKGEKKELKFRARKPEHIKRRVNVWAKRCPPNADEKHRKRWAGCGCGLVFVAYPLHQYFFIGQRVGRRAFGFSVILTRKPNFPCDFPH